MPYRRTAKPVGLGGTRGPIKDGTLNRQATGCPIPRGRVPYSIFGLFNIYIDTDAKYLDCMKRQGLQRHDIPVPGLLDRTRRDDAVDKAIDILDKLAGKVPLKGGPKVVIGVLAGRAIIRLTKVYRGVAKVEDLREALGAYQVLHDALAREIEKLEQENAQVKNMFDAAISDGTQRDTYTEVEIVNLLAALEPRRVRIRELRQVQRALVEEISAIKQQIIKVAGDTLSP